MSARRRTRAPARALARLVPVVGRTGERPHVVLVTVPVGRSDACPEKDRGLRSRGSESPRRAGAQTAGDMGKEEEQHGEAP